MRLDSMGRRLMRVYTRAPQAERFEKLWEPEPNSGCWIWTAATTTKGYPCFDNGLAHRWSYRHHVGPIPEGLSIDHLCRVRQCVNPRHMEPVTTRENTMRGLLPSLMSARMRAITHCKQGHPLFGPNLRLAYRADGQVWRKCATCVSRWQKELRARKAEA